MSQTESSQSKLEKLQAEALAQMKTAGSSQGLYDVKVLFLGKTGRITEILKEMGKLPPAEKPAFGQQINQVKNELENFFTTRTEELRIDEFKKLMDKERWDLTLPGPQMDQGGLHPLTLVTRQMTQIFSRLGYTIRTGPLIESDFFNFEALNIPADHPAREMQDTFFVDQDHVLRTHTSPIQIHVYQSEKPPIRMLGIGPVFRCDSDVSHLPNFHQIEGICVDHKVSMADLKGIVAYFVREFFGQDLKIRFRPSFFPFTEPSAEVDCQCPVCQGQGCNLCKSSGWIEIGGCGLVHPQVFKNAGVDAKNWQGFAFGFGIERMAIIQYGIPDIRLFPENNLSFLSQFRGIL